MMVELTDREAMAFRLLAQSGAWNLKKGSATIHFDSKGNPASAETRAFTMLHVIPIGEDDGQSFTIAV